MSNKNTRHGALALATVLILLSACTSRSPSSEMQQAESSEGTCSSAVAKLSDGFDGGNMGRCEVVDSARFKLLLSPEDEPINNSPWYAFKVEGQPGVVEVQMEYALHAHRYVPKFSLDRNTWQPLEADAVSISDDGRLVTLTIKVEQGPVWIAGQELFVQSDYDRWLGALVQEYGATLSTIGESAGGRPVYLLETQPQKPGDTLVLLGRAHPPEVTGALAMRHFVNQLFESHADFLATHKLFIVPLLNPDGVAQGYWRHGLGGLDLNRDWGLFTQPETGLVIQALNERIAQGDRPVLMLDFHSTRRNVFYTQTDEEDAQMDNFTQRWFGRARGMGVYPFEHARRHNEALPTSKNYFHSRFAVPAITFELGDNTPREAIEGSVRKFADALVEELLEERVEEVQEAPDEIE